MSHRERRKSKSAKMDMTPLIDVVFQLIVFFILTMTITVPDLKQVTLPAALTAVEEDPRENPYLVHLWNNASGSSITDEVNLPVNSWGIWLKGQNKAQNDVKKISEAFETAAEESGEGWDDVDGMDLRAMEVVVRGDMRCPSHFFALILEACIPAKIYKVELSIAPNDEGPPGA